MGVVGAISFALSMATISTAAAVHCIGQEQMLIDSQIRAMLTADVVAAIVSLGGYLVLTLTTLRVMRAPLAARPK